MYVYLIIFLLIILILYYYNKNNCSLFEIYNNPYNNKIPFVKKCYWKENLKKNIFQLSNEHYLPKNNYNEYIQLNRWLFLKSKNCKKNNNECFLQNIYFK